MQYDLIVAGSGAAGIMAAITAARRGKKVLLLEKLPKLAQKLKATGGGRCNLTNTLPNEEFIARFGKEGRFMRDALNRFDHTDLRNFMQSIGVDSHAPDGFRVFPITHSSNTIIEALVNEMSKLGVEIQTTQELLEVLTHQGQIIGVKTHTSTFSCNNVVVATGGLGYPTLGAHGDGYTIAKAVGHTTTPLYPAMMPLKTKEDFFSECRADTMPKVAMRIDLPKAKKLKAKGDLIFTKNGIRGPVVLDFARDITPLLETYGEVPILFSMLNEKNEEEIRTHLKKIQLDRQGITLLPLLETLLPSSVASAIIKMHSADPKLSFAKQRGEVRDRLIKTLVWTPLTVTGHDGFNQAMITRGGIKLKEIEPKTMQSRLIKGLFFCGEVMDIDGPCGGFNLQWSFASGHLAGHLAEV